MTNLLTFAEAMALDPSDVEWHDGVLWRSLEGNGEYTLDFLRKVKFRHARPRRSRLEEMATQYRESRGPSSVEAIIELAIRAVCKYLRTEVIGAPRFIAACDIEREFLEPR